MNSQRSMRRREFCGRLVFGSAALAGTAAWMGACGPGPSPLPENRAAGPGTGTGGEGLCFRNGGKARVEDNHGHELVVSKEDISAGLQRTYSIQGTADHDHRVTLTAMDFSNLQGEGLATEISSETAGHSHKIVVDCQ